MSPCKMRSVRTLCVLYARCAQTPLIALQGRREGDFVLYMCSPSCSLSTQHGEPSTRGPMRERFYPEVHKWAHVLSIIHTTKKGTLCALKEGMRCCCPPVPRYTVEALMKMARRGLLESNVLQEVLKSRDGALPKALTHKHKSTPPGNKRSSASEGETKCDRSGLPCGSYPSSFLVGVVWVFRESVS